MKPYVHGQSPTAKLVRAKARVNYLEDELARLRNRKPTRPDDWPAFHTPAFRAEYERERAWAAKRWPEPPEAKQARLDALANEQTQRTRRLAA